VRARTHDEIGELGNAFNKMVPQLQERIQIKQSLNVAREVQQHLLPSAPPKFRGFDVAGLSIYCDETGGDYFDYLDFSRNGCQRFGLALGDITGHGVAGALLMASARSLLRANVQTVDSLASLLNHVNQHLSTDVTGGRFMTLFCLLVDIEEQSIRWASAGHDPAIRYQPKTNSFDELLGGDLPLGIDPASAYHEYGPLNLRPEEVLVIGTDGIWEASNISGERFGKDRLRDVIRKYCTKTADQIANEISNAVTQFRGVRAQQDDITLIVLKVLPRDEFKI
jgi:phosphoserine phosphatase RsbU/P